MTVPKIDRAELIAVSLPLKHPFRTSAGVVVNRESLLLRLRCGGLEGFGECTAFAIPFYTYETLETAQRIAEEYLIPELLSLRNIDFDTMRNAFADVQGHPMAKAMVENAVADLFARAKGVPLYECIGGTKKPIMSGIALGLKSSIDALIDDVTLAVDKKYHRVKIKIKPGADKELISAIRNRFPDINLSVDANGSYDASRFSALRDLDGFNLDMIEQPLPRRDFAAHARLQKAIRTPICLDESIECVEDLKTAVSLGACRVVNIKQSRVGGLHRAIAIAEYARTNGIGVWSGGMLETGISRAVNLHLQTRDEFNLPGDTSETTRYFDEDIVDAPVVLDEDGFIQLPEGPGIGVDVNPDMLAKHSLLHKIV